MTKYINPNTPRWVDWEVVRLQKQQQRETFLSSLPEPFVDISRDSMKTIIGELERWSFYSWVKSQIERNEIDYELFADEENAAEHMSVFQSMVNRNPSADEAIKDIDTAIGYIKNGLIGYCQVKTFEEAEGVIFKIQRYLGMGCSNCLI